ncbi:Tctex1 domain-containing protein 2 [Boothiomyces sp. JEL0866]|nr:Tctex1 domain-containing protein 2 [Boothiomyces sp. JEL0866]
MAVDYDIWKLTRLANALDYHLHPANTSNNMMKRLLCPETLDVPIEDNNCILIFLVIASMFKFYNPMLLCRITETIFPCFPAYSDKTPINWTLKDRLSLVGLLIGRIKMDNASFINKTHQKFLIPTSTLDFLSRLVGLILLAAYPDSIDELPNYDYDSYFVDPFITSDYKFLSNLTESDIYDLSLVHLYILELFCITSDDLMFIESFQTLLSHYSHCVQIVLPENPELCQIMSKAEIEQYADKNLMSVEGRSTEIRLRLALGIQKMLEDPSYVIRPNFKQKYKSLTRFRPAVVTQVIHQILLDRLTNTVYNPETCSQSSREIADEIKNRLKDMEFDRYKFVVNVIMGEVRGEGVK